MPDDAPSITALTCQQAARLLSAAYRRQVTDTQVRTIVTQAELLRADGTFSLIDYVAYLAGEVTGG